MFLFATLWIFLALMASAGAVLYINYNGLVAMRQRCEQPLPILTYSCSKGTT